MTLPTHPTPRQMDCLRIIAEMTDATGFSPTMEELMREMDLLSKSGVIRLLDGLEMRGWLTRQPYLSRSIVLLHRPPMPDFSPITFILGPAIAGADARG